MTSWLTPSTRKSSANPTSATRLGRLTEGQHAAKLDRLRLRVNLVRPHIPEHLYHQYGACAALVGRLHMKAIRQRDAGVFVPWTELDDGSPDLPLRQLALELVPQDELDGYWTGRDTNVGTFRPVRPVTRRR